MNAFNNEMNSINTATNFADTTRDADTIRIADAFSHGPAFIPFVTAGDPTVDTTRLFVQQMVAAGADLIEIGIPFSNPTAEGPVIQGANIRVLTAGMTTDKAFELVHTLRDQDGVRVSLVFMTYANVVFSYPGGIGAFCERAAQAGVQGIILPDVPLEERAEFAELAHRNGLALIGMIAPTSHERIAAIAHEAEGFLY